MPVDTALHTVDAIGAGINTVAHLFTFFFREKKENKQINHRCSLTPVIIRFYWELKLKCLWAQKDDGSVYLEMTDKMMYM